MSTVLEVRNLAYGMQGRVLQRKLNFTVEGGELVVVTGPNGCGKSTLLRVLLGELRPILGEISLRIPRSRVESMPQLENTDVHLPLTLRDVLDISAPDGADWDGIREIGLLREEHLERAWNTASGGERKRTMLSRFLLRDPNLLILDEPMNHLDPFSRKTMLRGIGAFLAKSTEQSPKAAIMVCHYHLLRDDDGEFLDGNGLYGGKGARARVRLMELVAERSTEGDDDRAHQNL